MKDVDTGVRVHPALKHTTDDVPRYAPERVYCKGATVPVQSYHVYAPGAHPARCPLVPEGTALELRTARGSRWHVFGRAWINAELRMCVSGFDARDEVLRTWAVVPEDLRAG
jgi:hypothetical protein